TGEKPRTNFQLREPGFEESRVELLGTSKGSQRVVLRNPEARNDWKKVPKESSLALPEGFDLKKGEFGGYERIHANSTDYFVNSEGQAYRLKGDRLYPTKEIKVTTRENLDQASREVRSLVDPTTVRDAMHSLRDTGRTQDAVQRKVNEITKKLGLPEVRLTIAKSNPLSINVLADYANGRGEVGLLESDLNGWGNLRDSVSEKIIHELVHLEQDTLRVRRLADQLGIGKDFDSPEQLTRLQEAYKKNAFVELDADFARRVIKSREGRVLTEPEQVRADALITGKGTIAGGGERLRLARQVNAVGEMIRDLKGETTAAQFIDRIAKGEISTLQAFGDKVPERVAKWIETAREKDLSRAPGWNETEAKQILLDLMSARQQELFTRNFEIYVSNPVERDAWRVTRLAELESARNSTIDQPGEELRQQTYEATRKILDPAVQQKVLAGLDELVHSERFKGMSAKEKSQALTEHLQASLKKELGLKVLKECRSKLEIIHPQNLQS
ncbi:MAG: hypothetical protein K2Z81_09975, partial [Cyanobacteria bacterium]|nr:hypothetical protein [Cyanobacteriota bacterium]